MGEDVLTSEQRDRLAEAMQMAFPWPGELELAIADDMVVRIEPQLDRLIAHARAQALRQAAETLPEVGDVLRGMAARVEAGDAS